MVSEVKELFHTFNTPYLQVPEKDIYDTSEAASYSFLTDFACWSTSIAVFLFVIAKVFPMMEWDVPVQFSFSEASSITLLCSLTPSLAKRFAGFEKNAATETFVEKKNSNLFCTGVFVATALFVIPLYMRFSIPQMGQLLRKFLWPPVIIIVGTKGRQWISSYATSKAIKKTKQIYDDYSKHHSNILKLNPFKQEMIYAGMFAQKLPPPKLVIQSRPPFLKEFDVCTLIFKRSNPNPKTWEWLREKTSSVFEMPPSKSSMKRK